MSSEIPDVREKGKAPDGSVIASNRRLYMQLLAWTGCGDLGPAKRAMASGGVTGTLYADFSDPRGFAIVCAHEDPDWFIDSLRPVLQEEPFASLQARPELTMTGRSYTIGYENDLDHVLVNRPRRRLLNPDWPWAVYYPLRRNGKFARLERKEKMKILGEHGVIGRAYGEAGLAQDIRLACFGLDSNDNDFVVGLLGDQLHPLSHVVQRMRSTQQTSRYIEHLGPFFVGRAVYRNDAG